MKKLLGILLAMTLCVALVSCGSNAPEQQKINAMCEEKGVNVTCLIRISINPEFELVLDDQGTVCDVIRLNDDAERVFSQVTDIVMKSYDEAVEELLAAAKNSGYLTDKSTVSVTVILREDCEQGDTIISAVDETVQEFVSKRRCDMEVWDGRVSSDQPQNNNGKNNNDDDNTDDGSDTGDGGQETNGVEVRDANGKLVSRTTESPTPDGTMTTTEYFDANENRIKEVQEVNGTTLISEYDATGQRISLVQEFINAKGVPETRSTTYSYDASGKVAAEYTQISDGSYTETYYHENGSVARQYYQKANGSYWDSYYDPDGNLTDKKSKKYDDLGGWSEWTDYPDGSREEYYHAADGSVWFNWFDPSGTQLGQTRVQ